MLRQISFLPAILLAMPALAQDSYGQLSFGFGYGEYTDDGDPEGDQTVLTLGGYYGATFDGLWYIEGELRLDRADLRTAPEDDVNDGLAAGTLVAVRGGRLLGQGTLGAFVGYVESEADEGTAESVFYGLEGSYEVSPQFTVAGQLGYLDAIGGTEGEDIPVDVLHLALGGSYAVSDVLSLDASFALGLGEIDGGDPYEVRSLALGLSYEVRPGLEVFGRIEADRHFQGNEEDVTERRGITLGVTYDLGTGARSGQLPLPTYANWNSDAAGILE